jgi:hypothetical protein
MKIENKYKPKSIDDIIGNKLVINDIIEWITTFDNTTKFLLKHKLLKETTKGRKKKIVDATNYELELSKRKSTLLITGNHGFGKTLITNLICKHLNINIINITENINENIDINFLNKIIKPDNFFEEDNNKKIVVIDSYEKIISNNDKKDIFDLIKQNNFRRLVPIIIISNDNHNTNLSNLKKNVNLIKITELQIDKLKLHIKNICFEEDIDIDNSKIYDKIIKNSKFDIRKILFNLEILKKIYNNENIDEDKINYIFSILKNKDFNNDLFGIVSHIIKNKFNINDCIKLYKIHKMILSLTLYENYYKFCDNNIYNNIISNFQFGDLIENYIQSEHNYDLNILHSLVSCVVPSYYISTNYNNKNEKIDYPNDLNKTTIKKKFNKKKNKNDIQNNYYYNNKSIEELIYLNDIFE